MTDSSLTFLARRLRFLGYDVLILPGARLEDVFEAGRSERRTVLTLSARHPRRFAEVPARRIARGELAATLREIAAQHQPTGPPFSRCADCNSALQRRHPVEAAGEVPGRVLRGTRSLTFCPGCGKWYWEGSHVAHLRLWLEAALGHPLAPPAGSAAVE